MTLERAIQIAAKAHEGQVDLGGFPYILHPLRVMMRVHSMEEKIVAVLHDVLEDTDLSEEDLREHGFSEEIIDRVKLLTWNQRRESYGEYIARVAKDPVTYKVKRADIEDNLDPKRLQSLDPEKRNRLKRKYKTALYILNQERENGSR